MRTRFDEEPEPDEDPYEEPAAAAAAAGHVPTVEAAGREFEYRTEMLTAAEVADGKTLAARLTDASKDGWDLVDVIAAGERHAVLLRKVKPPEREMRRVGFAPPGH